MANVVEVIFKGNDKLSGPIGGIGKALGGLGKIALGVAAGGVAALGAGIAFTIAKAIPAASDLSETFNKIDVVFGDAADSIVQFAGDSAAALGQSKQSALDAAATFGVFGKSAGLVGDDLSGFSTDLVGLSADLASFYNADPSEVVVALGAALRGESEPMRKFGVLMDDASLRAQALKLGLISTTKDALTPQQKVLAANALILEQTADAQGDFARTSEGLANSQRIVKAQVENLTAAWGSAFLPVAEKVMGFLSATVLPAFSVLGDVLGQVVTDIVGGDGIGVAFDDLREGLFQVGAAFGISDETIQKFNDGLTVVYNWIKDSLVPFLQVAVPAAIKFLSDAWSNVLWPAIKKVWNWMSTVLIPFLVDKVYPWLQTYIPIALQFLSDTWTNVLKPAIEAVWSWMSTVLIPFLTNTVFPWLQEKIPAAIQTLSDFWTNTLQPAIEAVWTFLTVDMMPIWEALGVLLEVTVGKAIRSIDGYLERGPYLPALQDRLGVDQ